MSAPVMLLSGVTREHVQGGVVVHALRGVDLAVHAGELVAVTGPDVPTDRLMGSVEPSGTRRVPRRLDAAAQLSGGRRLAAV
jgi:hypothetical protein